MRMRGTEIVAGGDVLSGAYSYMVAETRVADTGELDSRFMQVFEYSDDGTASWVTVPDVPSWVDWAQVAEMASYYMEQHPVSISYLELVLH